MMFSQNDDIASASRVSQGTDTLRHAVALLGPDWHLLSPAASSPAVLANPAFGVILLDIAPQISPAAVERFRDTLSNAGFPGNCPGNLPVVHRVVPPEHLHRLPDIIDYALSWEAPLTIRPDTPWVARIREVLSAPLVGKADLVTEAAGLTKPFDVAEALGGGVPTAPPFPATLLLVGFGLLIAIGGGTVAMWRLLAAEPGASHSTLTAIDGPRPTFPGTTGGELQHLPDKPAAVPPSVPAAGPDHAEAAAAPDTPNPPDAQTVDAILPRPGDQAADRGDVPGMAGRNDAVPTQAGPDPVAPASPNDDSSLAKAATVEPEHVPGGDAKPPAAALLPTDETVAAAAAEGTTPPGGSTGAEQPPLPVDSATDTGPLRPEGMGGRSDDAETAATLPGPSPATSPIIPDQRQDGTTLAGPMAPAESRAGDTGPGVVPTTSSSLSRPSDALLANLLRRGDSMLALGDVAAARLFYERAAASGSGKAATALGKTYDPEVLARLGVPGMVGDAATAMRWYRTAQILGDAEASRLLGQAEHPRP